MKKDKVEYWECPVCKYRDFNPPKMPNWNKAQYGIMVMIPSCPKCTTNMVRRRVKPAKK